MSTFLNRPVLTGLVVALVVGLIVGAIIILSIPVSDLPPALLHPGYRDYYLGYVASDYAATHNLADARLKLGADTDRWTSKQVAEALRALANKSSGAKQDQLNALANDLERAALPKTAGGPNWTLVFLSIVVLVALVAAAVYFWVWPLIQDRLRRNLPQATAVRSSLASKAVEPTATWTGEATKPVAQFVTTYEIGDDRYDTSFSIETPTGDFMGECGVGISETIGVGSPDKVAAFEVWLFDKNDIRTVTKVLMSEYAYGDQALRAKLAPKGEPELARPDASVELETATLKVRTRVVEMDYGTGELEPRSFFNKLILELAAWPKENPAPAA